MARRRQVRLLSVWACLGCVWSVDWLVGVSRFQDAQKTEAVVLVAHRPAHLRRRIFAPAPHLQLGRHCRSYPLECNLLDVFTLFLRSARSSIGKEVMATGQAVGHGAEPNVHHRLPSLGAGHRPPCRQIQKKSLVKVTLVVQSANAPLRAGGHRGGAVRFAAAAPRRAAHISPSRKIGRDRHSYGNTQL